MTLIDRIQPDFGGPPIYDEGRVAPANVKQRLPHHLPPTPLSFMHHEPLRIRRIVPLLVVHQPGMALHIEFPQDVRHSFAAAAQPHYARRHWRAADVTRSHGGWQVAHMTDDLLVGRGKAIAERLNTLAGYQATTSSTVDDVVASRFRIDEVNGAALLDELEKWFKRFIAVTFDGDLALLALWTVHTHLARELYTTPRLQLDSTMPGSGKTTVLDHFSRLCHRPVQIANLSSPALLPRLLETGVRTILLDEVDRSLRPDGASVPELIGIINSGYRAGASRPVLIPVKGGGWEAKEMPTHAPVSMAGNSPNLPDDTRSRILRILLMPDLDGSIEDSDWELIETDAVELHDKIARFADEVRDQVKGLAVELPDKCIGRAKEKWRPLKRVAAVAGGRWPSVADVLIARGLDEDDAEREAGLRTLPPGMILLADLRQVWPDHDDLVPTRDLVSMLTAHNADYWGEHSSYGKALTETRFGKVLAQASKVTSQRPGGRGSRGYFRSQLVPVWHRLGITQTPPGEPGALGEPGEAGANDARLTGSTGCTGLNRVTSKCRDCGTELRPDNSAGVCAECALDARNKAVADRIAEMGQAS